MPRREHRGWYDVGDCACGRPCVAAVGAPLICVQCSETSTEKRSWLRRLLDFFTGR